MLTVPSHPSGLSGLQVTFADEFEIFAASPTGVDPITGALVWRTTYGWGGRTNAPNNEVEYYSDATVGVDPFRLDAGTLDITAAPASSTGATLPSGLTHTSGMVTTQASFAQLYGYFEVRAELPSGAGFWPAFWLLPTDGTWPPELDVMELLGQDTGTAYTTLHSGASGSHTSIGAAVPVADASAGFHTYGVSWRPDEIRWFVDGAEVFHAATPADMHVPMYMLVNLAVGGAGSWPGPTDGVSSATMRVDYVRAFQYADLARTDPAVPAERHMQVLAGTGGADWLASGGGDDRIAGSRGDDTLSGAAGADVFVFSRGDGRDVVGDFKPGIDQVVFEGVDLGKLATKMTAAGLQISYGGKDSVLLKGISQLVAGDIVAAPAPLAGTDGDDMLDRSVASSAAKILGGRGNDTILGGRGDDWLEAGYGDDVTSGGSGADSFVLGIYAGHDVVLDFASGVDRLVLKDIDPSTVRVRWTTYAGAPGVEVDYGTTGDSVRLARASGLADGDIVFA